MLYADAKPTLQDLQYMSCTSEDGRTVSFRLTDRIKPRVTKLAIALRFPQHILDNLKTEQDPVIYLLTEWLRGGNQEVDTRPLTWGTLITALKEADLVDEFEILQQNMVAATKGGKPASCAVVMQKRIAQIAHSVTYTVHLNVHVVV